MTVFFFLLIMDEFLSNFANESTFFKLLSELLLDKEVEEDNLVKPFCHWFKSDKERFETLCFLEIGVNSSIPSLFKYDWNCGDCTAWTAGEVRFVMEKVWN